MDSPIYWDNERFKPYNPPDSEYQIFTQLEKSSLTTPFVDLKSQYKAHKQAIDAAIQAVLDHGQYVMGPEIIELESQLAEYAGVEHAITCGSGTQALVMPLMTFDLRRSDAVFTPSYSFVASAETVSLAGGTPVLVDVDPATFNLSPDSLRAAIEKTMEGGTLSPRGIIPVDLFGLPADYDAINQIATEYGLFVLEDAAQAFGASYNGKRTGSLTHVASTSFFPAKPLGCYGDGGAIFTDDQKLAEKLISIRVHGQGENQYDNVRIGLNARMDTIQAAILLQKMSFYEDELALRAQFAERYTSRLTTGIKTQKIPTGCTSIWAQYSVLSENRDAMRAALDDLGIPTQVYYPTPLHRSPAYQQPGRNARNFPVSDKLASQMFSLPMHPYLEDQLVDQICDTINEYA